MAGAGYGDRLARGRTTAQFGAAGAGKTKEEWDALWEPEVTPGTPQSFPDGLPSVDRHRTADLARMQRRFYPEG